MFNATNLSLATLSSQQRLLGWVKIGVKLVDITYFGVPWVMAIAAGRVVFADWLRGFGNLLIIDHGGGYMSLYGNNESLYKEVGAATLGGETVAAVGNSGGNANSGLYFEIRHQGKAFDPLVWVNLK